jgi:DnaA-homolog protein
VSEQVTLPFSRKGRKSLAAFYAASNGEVLELVRSLASSDTPRMAYLHGAPESGKSHLLQGAATLAREQGRISAYIAFGESGIQHTVLAQLNPGATLCLDDLERIAGDPDWERSLLDLYERSQHAQGRLLFAASMPPSAIGIKLADLVSRLGAQPVYRVNVLSPAQRAQALTWEAQRRGLIIAPATVEWLMRRVPRGTRALFDLLDQLDRASLEEGRKVTIPFLRSIGLG